MLELQMDFSDQIKHARALLRKANKKLDQETARVYQNGRKTQFATPEQQQEAKDAIAAARRECDRIIEQIDQLHDQAGHDAFPEGGLMTADGRIFLERTQMTEGDDGAMAHEFYFANGGFDGEVLCTIRRWGRGKCFLLQPAPQFERVFTAEGGEEVPYTSLWRATKAVHYGFSDVQDMYPEIFGD